MLIDFAALNLLLGISVGILLIVILLTYIAFFKQPKITNKKR